jgi:hypothetical protein
MNKVIVRIRGGLGNQLFSYAAARRVALANDSELVLDDVTGFVRDRQYRRQPALHHFHISARSATPAERLEPFERYRRGVMKWIARRSAFESRRYVEQEGRDFDERLLSLQVKGTLYLDGLWQSEAYFKDVEQTLREDLRIIRPTDALNDRLGTSIRSSKAVALHVRWFDAADSTGGDNVSTEYYQRAVALLEEKIDSPQYFLFSDDPEAARRKLVLPERRVTFVSHNRGDENAYADLWLMTQCQHFITANSTFSWWGAWLGGDKGKIVVCPEFKRGVGRTTAWNFPGQLPSDWVTT